MNVTRSISFKDLLQYPLFKIAAKQDDKKIMEDIFYAGGIDISKEYEIQEVLHRPASSNEPWFGLRVSGHERLDQEWRHSGHCSIEAYLYTEDKSLTDELNSLDPKKAKRRFVDVEDECELSSDEREIGGGE